MKFEPRNLRTIICKHIFHEQRPVLLVEHDKDGDWSFMCGFTDHSTDTADGEYFVVGVGHLTDGDPTLDEISDLAPGWLAERREVGADWERLIAEDEDDRIPASPIVGYCPKNS